MNGSSAPPVVLASASPRRHQLLSMLSVPHEVKPVSIDEVRLPGEAPREYAGRLALEKARAGADRNPGRLVLGADTIVVLDDAVLEKPVSTDDAVAMLHRLAGRAHKVVSAVALTDGSTELSDVDVTTVWFRQLDDAIIRAYVETGEPMDKAGGYGIQGQGAVLVARIEGDYFGVMGLPLVRVVQLLERAGRPFYFTL